jgi:hypothetical protein
MPNASFAVPKKENIWVTPKFLICLRYHWREGGGNGFLCAWRPEAPVSGHLGFTQVFS